MEYEKRLVEFSKIEDLEKFSSSCTMQFNDKTYTYKWFCNYRKEIFAGTDKYCRMIMSQYDQYLQKLYKSRLVEFLEIECLEKFSKSGGIKFEDGTSACNWFSINKNEIFKSNDTYSKLVKKQYEKYIHYLYDKRLVEFSQIKTLKKFERRGCIKLEDRKSAHVWFWENKNKIFKSKDEYSKLIMTQYEEYKNLQVMEKKKKQDALYKEKLIEFSQIENLQKFSQLSDVKLSNDKLAGNWFSANRKKIMNGTDEYSKLVVSQYEQHIKSEEIKQQEEQRKLYKERLIQFSKIEDITKFTYHCNLKLKGDIYSGIWFSSNKKKIFASDDEYSKLIVLQYQEYITSLDEKRNGQSTILINGTSFEKRIYQEFLECEDNSKFEFSSSIKLSNGEYIGRWFAKNMKILSYKDPICIKIKEQYDKYKQEKLATARKQQQYKKTIENICVFKKDEIYFSRLTEKYKFSIHSNIILPSGTPSGIWFKKYEDYIYNNFGPYEEMIKEQHGFCEDFIQLVEMFCDNSDLNKFDPYSSPRFPKGGIMYDWWEDKENKGLLNDDFYLYNMIREQYESYCNSKGIAYTKKSFQKK